MGQSDHLQKLSIYVENISIDIKYNIKYLLYRSHKISYQTFNWINFRIKEFLPKRRRSSKLSSFNLVKFYRIGREWNRK